MVGLALAGACSVRFCSPNDRTATEEGISVQSGWYGTRLAQTRRLQWRSGRFQST